MSVIRPKKSIPGRSWWMKLMDKNPSRPMEPVPTTTFVPSANWRRWRLRYRKEGIQHEHFSVAYNVNDESSRQYRLGQMEHELALIEVHGTIDEVTMGDLEL